MVRLTVNVNPSPPLTAYSQLFVNFYYSFILDYDYMYSEKDFTQEKVIIIQLLESPIFPYCSLQLS